jgi:hypothetical protein
VRVSEVATRRGKANSRRCRVGGWGLRVRGEVKGSQARGAGGPGAGGGWRERGGREEDRRDRAVGSRGPSASDPGILGPARAPGRGCPVWARWEGEGVLWIHVQSRERVLWAHAAVRERRRRPVSTRTRKPPPPPALRSRRLPASHLPPLTPSSRNWFHSGSRQSWITCHEGYETQSHT